MITLRTMRQWRSLLLAPALLGVSMASCGADDMADAEAAALSEKDMRRGRLLFMQCSACHALTPGDNGGKIGPSLAGVFERNAGSAAHYNGYSVALKEAGHVWNSESMTRWLTDPAEMVPGTSMVFAGISDEAQRALLVRYLEVVTRDSE